MIDDKLIILFHSFLFFISSVELFKKWEMSCPAFSPSTPSFRICWIIKFWVLTIASNFDLDLMQQLVSTDSILSFFKTSSKDLKSLLSQTQRCLKTFWKLKIEKLFILNPFWMKNFPSAASSADLYIIHWLWLRRWFDQLESFIKWKQSLSNDATISSSITNQPLFAHLRFVCLGPVYFFTEN